MRLSTALTRRILSFLHIESTKPDIDTLNHLIHAYVRHVPWESASRIVKRAKTVNTADCPRWPDTFWEQTLEQGTGGTCFESNFAFFAFLQSLEFDGYLTINNMGDTVGCHTAIIVLLEGEKWLVDAGLPIYVPLKIMPDTVTQHHSPLQNYNVHPLGDDRYDITRHPHPKSNAFTLIDRPIDEDTYRRATIADYGDGGLFLDHVIINKVIDEVIWRFTSAEKPYHIEHFSNNRRNDIVFEDQVRTPMLVAEKFAMDKRVLVDAFDTLDLL